MMNLKMTGFPDLKKTAVVVMVIVIVIAFIKSLPLNESVQAFAVDEEKIMVQEDIFRMIIDKTIPMLDVSMNNDGDRKSPGYTAYAIFKHITRIDFTNPRTYLVSEIPLLGLLDITVLTGNVEGVSSDGKENGEAKEETPKPQIDVASRSTNFNDKPLENVKIDAENPGVIIFHTHTTESFIPTPQYNYEMMGDHRTTDRNFNVCSIGEEIKNYLEKYYGIGVAHDMTLHDYPSYEGSYSRSKPTVEKLIKKYQDTRFIIDIHRDAFPDDDIARTKMVTNIRGDQAAKIMFVIGKSNPHWQENYYLALKLNQKMEELYPGLTKEILVKDRSIYNQDISNKLLLIEIGSECNTLEESLVSAKMVAKALGEVLKSD